jgi:hypothetical protein
MVLMGKLYERIDDGLRTFIEAQHLFFVGTAPLDPHGHVNISPKGLHALRVLDDRTIAYIDYVGSGAETIAHVRENARITVMFCAFSGNPKVVRLHGRGCILEPQDGEFETLRPLFPPAPGVRAIVRVDVERVSGSCGFGVPLFSYERDRTMLGEWAERKGDTAIVQYQRDKNRASIDGLPALRWAEEDVCT